MWAQYYLEKLAAAKVPKKRKGKNEQKDEESRLAVLAQNHDPFAMKKLVASMEGIIQSKLNDQFYNTTAARDLNHQHLVGLTQDAIMSYNPELAQLNTHVFNHISKKGMRFGAKYGNIAKMDENEFFIVGPVNEATAALRKGGHVPTPEEITDWVTTNYPDRKKKVTPELVRKVQKNNKGEVPGSTVIKGGEGGMTMGDITNASVVDPEETMAERIKKDALQGAIAQLSPDHQKILMHKEGIFGHERMNDAQIAMEYNFHSPYWVKKMHVEAKDLLRSGLSKLFGNSEQGS